MRTRIILFCILLSLGLSAQDDTREQFIHRGLLRSAATISPGLMFNPSVTNIYTMANLEYYVDNNVSIRGESAFYVSSMATTNTFELNHSTFAGANYHFQTKSHLDPYIGFAPGASLTRLNHYTSIVCDPGPCQELINPDTKVDPLASAVLGFNFYFQKLFHLYMETRYVYGMHFSNADPVSLSELRFAFGLGWNINLLKKKKA